MNAINKDFLRDPVFPECPIRNVLARISSKWSLAVLYTLDRTDTPMRFKDIEKANPDISQKMLTSTLRGLEADALTDRGRSFMPVMRQLLDWAYVNLHDILSDREHYISESK